MSNDIWFSGDWHYGHENRVRGVSKWPDTEACRNFNTLEEHNEVLIQNINACAKQNDTIYMVGDWSLGGRQNIYELRRRIVCENIHICLGNHDHHIRKNAILAGEDGTEVRAHSLFTSVNDIISKKIAGERMVLCHYSMRTWENGHHGSIMLYGHSHGTLPDYELVLPVTVHDQDGIQIVKRMEQKLKFKTMDVGIDTHKKFLLYHIDEIRQEMATRIPLRVDHHQDT